MADISNRIGSLSADKLKQLMKKLDKNKGDDIRFKAIKKIERNSNVFKQSFTQQRQWFLEQLMPGAVSNVPQAMRITGDLSIEFLEKSINEIIKRHESLRTTFKVVDGEPSQIIHEYKEVKLDIMDLSSYPDEAREAEAMRIAKAEAIQPFDIAIGPLLRNKLIKMGEQEYIFIINMHHIISDGWSFGVAINELATLYNSYKNNQGKSLPELPIQYVDYSEWQHDVLQDESIKKQLDFWKKELADVPSLLKLPYDKPRPAVQSYNGEALHFNISKEKSKALQLFCEKEGVTMYHCMLAAFTILLNRYSLQKDICIGTPVASRKRKELEVLIGPFINTIVFRTFLSGNPSYRELVKKVKKSMLAAYDNQEIPFEKLADELQIERDIAHSPIFQVLYVQTEGSMVDVEISGIKMEPMQIHSGTAQFDLSLFLTVMPDGIINFFEYNTDLFDKSTIEMMVQDFKLIVDEVSKNQSITLLNIAQKIPAKSAQLLLVSGFTSKPVEDSIQYWIKKFNFPAQVSFSPYSQVFQQLISKESEFNTNHEGVNILLIRIEDWIQGLEAEEAVLLQTLEDNVSDFIELLKSAMKVNSLNAMVYVCPPSDKVKTNKILFQVIQNLENKIIKSFGAQPNTKAIHYNSLISYYKVSEINDPLADEQGHIPYTVDFFTALGSSIVKDLIIENKKKKNVCFDFDNIFKSDFIELNTGEAKSYLNTIKKHKTTGSLVHFHSSKETDEILAMLEKSGSNLKPEDISSISTDLNKTTEALLKSENATLFYLSPDAENCRNVLKKHPKVITIELPDEMSLSEDIINKIWI